MNMLTSREGAAQPDPAQAPSRLPRVRLGALLLALVLAVLLPALGVGGYATWRAIRTGEAAAEARLRDTAAALALAMDREIGSYRSALLALASSRTLDGPDPDIAGFEEEARRVTGAIGTTMALMDAASLRQIVNTALPPGARAGHVAHIELGAAAQTGRPVVTNLIPGAAAGQLLVGVAVPVIRDGRTPYVLAARLSPGRLRALLGAQPLPEGGFASVTDARDVIVARSDALQESLVGQQGSAEVRAKSAGLAAGIIHARTADGVDRVVAFNSLSAAPGWRVFVAEPAASFAAARQGPTLALAAGGAVLLLAGSILVLLATRGVLLPLHRLGRHAAALAAGDGGNPAATLPPTRVRELEVLRRGFAGAEAAVARREAERAASERRFRTVFESTAIGMARVAFEGERWLEVNDALCRMLGRSREEMLATPWTAMTHPDDVERGLIPFRRMARGEIDSYASEKRFLHADGHPVWARLTLSLVRDAAGRPDYEIAVIEDITERRATEEAVARGEQRLRAVLESTADGVFSLDPGWRLSFLNRNAVRLVARGRDILGQNLWDAFPEAVGSAFWLAYHRCMAERVATEAEEYYAPLGRVFAARAFPSEGGGITVFFQDVTEARAAARRLAESEARYRTLFDNMAEEVHFWQVVRDAAGNIATWRLVDANPPALRSWGRTLEQVRGRTTDEIFGPGAAAHYLPLVERIMRERTPAFYEDYFPHLDRHFRFASVPLDEHFITTGADITEQKRTEARIRESEERLRRAEVVANVGSYDWDVAQGVMALSEGYAALHGLPPGTASETFADWLARLHPEDRERAAAQATDLAEAAPLDNSYRILRPRDGAVRCIAERREVVRDAAGRALRVIGLQQDVTERRDAEAALARSNAEARIAAERVQLALAAGAIVGTWDWELPTDRFTVDERFAESFGLDPEIGRTGLSLAQVIATVHPEDVPGLRAAIAEVIARGGAYSHDYRVRGRDGVYRWIQANGRVDHGPDGTPLRFPGVLIDIGGRRALEEERDRAAGLLRAFADAVPGVVYAKDRAGRMLVANRGTTALIGKPPEFYIGRTDAEFLDDPDQAAAVMANDRRIMESGIAEQVEEKVSLPDGTPVVWLSHKAPFRDAEGRVIGLIGASMDITTRKQAEAVLARSKEELERLVEARTAELRASETRLAEAARMEALGRLAGGIAHDFNNVLQAIQGGISLASRRIARDPAAARHFLDLALDATERGAAVTGRLLAFARRGELAAGPVEPAPLLTGLAQILKHTLGPGVTLAVAAEEGTPALLADAAQLEAVLVNLANNARDALPGGSGTITLRAEAPADAACLPAGLAPGGHVRLSVADDGEGMPPEVLARVTEPFFTTKPKGKGTGLGLAMARGFAEQSGGVLSIDSAPGRGTTVSLWLPRAPADARPPHGAPDHREEAADAPGTAVLLVDDEAGVRATVAAGLAERGHRVTEAADAAAALAALDAGAAVEVLVTDLSMPGGMDGLALVREARRRRPGLPALLITGHAGEAAQATLREAAGAGPFAVLRKPAPARAVAAQVARLLQAEAAE